MLNISEYKPELDIICREMQIKRLWLFGSALREDFEGTSDVDIIVDFERSPDIDYFTYYFDLKEKLTVIFGRDVDLIVHRHFKNPFFRSSVEKNRQLIYER